ncbi:hydantoinase/oxoprolinase family protein [Lentibacillus jeotgali]|uniref:hydantoinase/oxoprolinase family protein n=1 Tax=Lentibacillus jeotgali TaxID=558169 RepID=UPI0002627C7E|nr:hydantoinase/oxoprolinase family protein [Lentibacillus jeotgali]
MKYRLGVDTGGTFTDIALLNEETGEISVSKVPSTPDNPSQAVLKGSNQLLKSEGKSAEDISFFIHGTTVATNTLLERKGAKTALITTEGFKDVLEIGRQARPDLYDFRARKSEVLIPRNLRYEVSERILHTGDVISDLDIEETRSVIQQLKKLGVQSIAVSLINSYVNNEHEKRIKGIIEEEYDQAYVTISSEILSEYKEYERTSSVVANSYVLPKMNRYIHHLSDNLKANDVKSDLYIMQSNGGVIDAETARDVPARTVLSGPAGGTLAGQQISQTTDFSNLITIDMGGTSLDTSLIKNGEPQFTTLSEINGNPIKFPMVEMHTIGSGGGSIAWIDSGGALRVGPHSAGSEPGPVCYDKGGYEPTVTDADVILGKINPDYILGGDMQINIAKAKAAVEEKIAKPLNLSIEEAAEGILRVVNANMVRGIRVVSLEKGHDPRDFALVAFGGAGPLHAVDLARELLCETVIVPSNPGITSAIGMLTADVRHDYVQTVAQEAHTLNIEDVHDTLSEMQREALEQLNKEGFAEKDKALVVELDLRYAKQAHEISVPLDVDYLDDKQIDKAINKFHDAHKEVYGFSREGEIIELVNIRLIAFGNLSRTRLNKGYFNHNKEVTPIEHRNVFFDGNFYETPVFNRTDLSNAFKLTGPAVVEQLDSTIVIGPNQEAQTDVSGNLIINLSYRRESHNE